LLEVNIEINALKQSVALCEATIAC